MITHVPMLLVILLLCIAEDLQNKDSSKAAIFSSQKMRLLIVALLALLAAYLGYKVNTDIFPKYFTFSSYDETTLGGPNISLLNSILFGFLHHFGFRRNIPLLSILGILSVGGIVSAVFSLHLSFKVFRSHKAGTDIRKTIVSLFFPCFTVVMTVVFLITTASVSHNLYYVLGLPWVAPMLLSIPQFFVDNTHPFNFKRIFSWVAVLVLFINGFANIAFFNGVEQFDQVYEGLVFQEKDKASQMTDLVNYLLENGYDAGYATFWESNIITELSDGKLPMVTVELNGNETDVFYLSYYDWLTSMWQREAPKEKPFLIINADIHMLFEKSLNAPYCTRIYFDDYHYVYCIDDLENFSNTLYY